MVFVKKSTRWRSMWKWFIRHFKKLLKKPWLFRLAFFIWRIIEEVRRLLDDND